MISPWKNLRPASFQNVAHAFMAADIGMHLERAGFKVFSEREVITSTTVAGQRIDYQLQSTFQPGGSGKPVVKTPDIAIPSSTTKNFIAVEIERDEDRPLRVYTDKLRAYQGNPSIAKVWYCYREGTKTAHRVQRAAHSLWGDDYAKFVRLVPCALRRDCGVAITRTWPTTAQSGDFYEMGSIDMSHNVAILNGALKDLEALK